MGMHLIAIGTKPVPELICSMGTARHSACALSEKRSQKVSKIDTPVPFNILATDA